MIVIYRGRRCFVPDDETRGAGLELTIDGDPPTRARVALDDPDLVMSPTPEDLQLAEAFERGEVGAFEYGDGHTYPANRETAPARKRKTSPRVH